MHLTKILKGIIFVIVLFIGSDFEMFVHNNIESYLRIFHLTNQFPVYVKFPKTIHSDLITGLSTIVVITR